MGTVIKNRGTSCVGVRKTGTTLIHVSTVMGTLYTLQELSKLSDEELRMIVEATKNKEKDGNRNE